MSIVESNIDSTIKLSEENLSLKKNIEELNEQIETLLSLSSNEFSMLKAGIDEALKLLRVDPIVRIQTGIDAKSIAEAIKSNIDFSNVAESLDESENSDTVSNTADDKAGLNSNESLDNSNTLDLVLSSENGSDSSETAYLSEVRSETIRRFWDLNDSKKNHTYPELDSLRNLKVFLSNKEKMYEKRRELMDIALGNLDDSKHLAEVKLFINSVGYAKLFSRPELTGKKGRIRYAILAKIVNRTFTSPENSVIVTNLAFNTLSKLAYFLSGDKIRLILNVKYCTYIYGAFEYAVEYVLKNIEELREAFVNYNKESVKVGLTVDELENYASIYMEDTKCYEEVLRSEGQIRRILNLMRMSN